MAYELRIDHARVAVYADADAALAHVKRAVRERPDCEPEIIDTETGRAFEPAASERWRDELAKKIGY